MSMQTADTALRRELALRRRLRDLTARESLPEFARLVMAEQNLHPAAHHHLLLKELQAVAHGTVDRLLITMPPGSAKSTYASRIFPAWLMALQSGIRIIGASHTADLADHVSRGVQSCLRDYAPVLGTGLRRENARDWEAANGSAYKAVGIGGPIAGRRADVAIIDDPVKSRADADSRACRERVWNWFGADLRTRMKPGGRIVVIMTRWHEDDLGGRLLLRQGSSWRRVNLPAQAEDNDPLGRAPGEWLWGDDSYGYAGELQRVKAEYERGGAMRDWAALYQQQPRPAEGALFKTAALSCILASPASVQWVRAWDLAATRQTGTGDPDWTVGARLGRDVAGRFVIGDIVRLRGGPEDVTRIIAATASRDGASVRISIPRDPGQAGKAQAAYLARMLSGYVVETSPESGDKSTRAMPFAAQVNAGNVDMLPGAWQAALLDELAGFPSARHDDQVDALSRAFLALMQGRDTRASFLAYL
ncbi:Large terminase subunit [Granulibacter bethesdensis]|uniref:Large terminase subunit n=1 Tax=Granulibacter bethesdensis TaxID=364410 RepID=A0AAC9P8T8_9PROT|nr:phage terminase large subunit [Granulibacter bethesdensis]APH54872.1 Large terminase subunit [Granulibacter bethesdensis]APH62458.1 Large terminase subunit [Granulibacter bethesdensis]